MAEKIKRRRRRRSRRRAGLAPEIQNMTWLTRLRAVADLKLLLAVFCVVLGAMGIFAYSFKETWIGFVEEEGYVVTSEKLYDYLSAGTEDADIVLSKVSPQDDIYRRGGEYYVGKSLEKFDISYPVIANGGSTLYFMDDSAKLISEEFEPLMTYAGIFVTGGNSFNSGREQKDIERIYLVRLSSGLYMNVLPITVQNKGQVSKIRANSILYFGDEDMRGYMPGEGVLSYCGFEDMKTAVLSIDGKEFLYGDFMKYLNSGGTASSIDIPQEMTEEGFVKEPEFAEGAAGSGSATESGESTDSEDGIGEEGEGSSTAEEETDSETANEEKEDAEDTEDGEGDGESEGEESEDDEEDDEDGEGGGEDDSTEDSEDSDSSDDSSEGSGSGDGDGDGDGGDGSGDGDGEGADGSGDGEGDDSEGDGEDGDEGDEEGGEDEEEGDDEDGGDGGGSDGEGGDGSGDDDSTDSGSEDEDEGPPASRPGTPTQRPYIEPTVSMNVTSVGPYSMNYSIGIDDPGHYLKKVIVQAQWSGGKASRSVKEAGDYTLSNLRSGQKLTLTVTMNYYDNNRVQQKKVVWESKEYKTISIAEGTNTLHLTYTPDTYDNDLNKPLSARGGYDQIYPHQIEIRGLAMEEGNDSNYPEKNTTFSYIRKFKVLLYKGDNSHDYVTEFSLNSSQRKKLLITTDENGVKSGGLDWKSDVVTTSLDTNSEFYYEFSIVDRWGDSMKLSYDNGGEYDSQGNLLEPWSDQRSDTDPKSGRKAYTCKDAPTGNVSISDKGVSYDRVGVKGSLTNPQSCEIKDVYLTVRDVYNRYVEYDNQGNSRVGATEITDQSKFSLMEGGRKVDGTGTIPTYIPFDGSSFAVYKNNATGINWENITLPSFADSTYTVSLRITYDTGDRKGSPLVGQDNKIYYDGTYYDQVLASRSNLITSTIGSIGSVNFQRSRSTQESHSANFSYTSEAVNAQLLPLLYRYDYTMTNADAAVGDSPFLLRISKKYEELDKGFMPFENYGGIDQGIILTYTDDKGNINKQTADDWHVTYRARCNAGMNDYWITGDIYLDTSGEQATIRRDVWRRSSGYYYEKEYDTDAVYLGEATEIPVDINSKASIANGFAQMLQQLNTYANLIPNTTETGRILQDPQVSFYFQPKTEVSGDTIKVLYDINKNYTFSLPSSKLLTAFQTPVAVGESAERDFSQLVLLALSNQGQLVMRVSGMESNSTYTAKATAYTYQVGSAENRDDAKIGETSDGRPIYRPEVTRVTGEGTSNLTVYTLKSPAIVNMDMFPATSELLFFKFYVLDKDYAIVPIRSTVEPKVYMEIYEQNEEKEKLYARVETYDNGEPLKIISDLSQLDQVPDSQITIRGVTAGTTYRIKVYAEAYDITRDGSKVLFDQLIGDDVTNSSWEDTGIWEAIPGQTVITGLSLEKVVSEDPQMLGTQLLNMASAGDAGSGWEHGYPDGDNIVQNTSNLTSPFIDLRGADGKIDASAVYLMRGYNTATVYYYNAAQEYLGSCSYPSYGTAPDNYCIVTMPTAVGAKVRAEDIAYARVRTSAAYANHFFFGRMDTTGYLTKEENFAGQLMGTENLMKDFENISYGTIKINNTSYGSIYSQEITLDPAKRYFLHERTIHTNNGTYPRAVLFLDSEGNPISKEYESGSTTNWNHVGYNSIYVVPEGTETIRVQANYSNKDTKYRLLQVIEADSAVLNKSEEFLDNVELVSEERDYVENQKHIDVMRNRRLNTTTGASKIDSSALWELTGYIKVNPGDIYYMGNSTTTSYTGFYDNQFNYVGYMTGGTSCTNYLLVPDGVEYIRMENYRENDTTYDRSLLNGATYNENGTRTLTFIFIKNVADLYTSRVANSQYAAMRVQLQDSDNHYFSDGKTSKGAYQVELFELPYNGVERLDTEFTEATRVYHKQEEIPQNSDGSAKVIDQTYTITVKPGHTYKAVLHAKVGSYGSIKLDSCYFTVAADGTPLYGISNNAQFYAISSDTDADYVLNKSITLDPKEIPSTHNYTFLGTLDLQGNILTTKQTYHIFYNIGSRADRSAVIKNGTIYIDKTINYTGTLYQLTVNNYGTLENIFFKVDMDYPVDEAGNETNSYMKNFHPRVIETNHGTIQNFTVEYIQDLRTVTNGGFIISNNGVIKNGYIYAEDGIEVKGGSNVSAFLYTNNASGTIQSVYNTVDVWVNSIDGLGGGVVRTNNGIAKGLLSTGNIYSYSALEGGDGNFTFTDGEIYANKGSTVGETGGKMKTSDSYYANVGDVGRVEYSKASKNIRIESGILIDPSWHESVFGTDALDMDNLVGLLADGYFPWMNMGEAAKKYSMIQPYISMNAGTSSDFDLIKTELDTTYGEDGYIYDDDGYATAMVNFTFLNPADYRITDITATDITITIVGDQVSNESTGFTEVKAQVTLKDKEEGGYYDQYEIDTIRCRNSKNNVVTKPYSNHEASREEVAVGYRYVDVPFFYPLQDTMDWEKEFKYERMDWNFRIWGDEVWDFAKAADGNKFYAHSVIGYTPDANKVAAYSGHLDGTLFVKDTETGLWKKAYDENGTLRLHTLKNMSDYHIRRSNTGAINTYNMKGFVFYQLNGSITNLNFDQFSVGIVRSWHLNAKMPGGNQLYDAAMEDPFGGAQNVQRHISGGSYGIVRYMGNYASMDNVHVENSYINPYYSGNQRIGVLVGESANYCALNNCSVTDTTITSSEFCGELFAGGIIGQAGSYGSMTGCYVSGLTMTLPNSKNQGFIAQGSGGLVGYVNQMTMSGCYSAGNIKTDIERVGGLVGRTVNTTSIERSYSSANIITNAINVGGLVGNNGGTLNLSNTLYTGSLNSSMDSDAVGLLLGSNNATFNDSENYVYQPFATGTLENGLTFEQLTGSTAFYEQQFGSEFLYSWGDTGTTAGYLPAVPDEGSNETRVIAYGQNVPVLANPNMKISNVWAYESHVRKNLAGSSSVAYPEEYKYYYSGTLANLVPDSFNTVIPSHMAIYTPNDLDFTLDLGSSSSQVKIRSIQVDGTAVDKNTDGNTVFGSYADTAGIFTTQMAVQNTAYRVNVTAKTDGEGNSTGIYYITLSGLNVLTYRDNYTLSVTLNNGVTLTETFQFRNSVTGEPEPKYLRINNAYEWNLYMGDSGVIPAKVGAYQNWKYYGYGDEGINVELVGVQSGSETNLFDFGVLDDVEIPVTNVVLGNIRGVSVKNQGETVYTYPTKITNLNPGNISRNSYGLARTVNGKVSGLNFENITIAWNNSTNASNPAKESSGIFGTVNGGMENCTFSNVKLTGGGSYFGVVGTGYGTYTNITLKDIWVESTSYYAGGLVGRLYGDLIGVKAYGTGNNTYRVSTAGSYGAGGVVGRMYDTEHSVNGHELIGGVDYTGETPSQEYSGLYKASGSDQGWYLANQDKRNQNSISYQRDSLTNRYMLLKDVEVYNVEVVGTYYVGGISGYTGPVSTTIMGYGHVIMENVTVGEKNPDASEAQVKLKTVRVTSTRIAANDSYAGGVTGIVYNGAVFGHNVMVNGVEVKANGHYAGGFTGYQHTGGVYDYSAWKDEITRIESFLNAFDTLTVQNVNVTGENYVAGIVGYQQGNSNYYKVQTKNITTLSTGVRTGGLFGYTGSNYMNDLTAENMRVYSAGLYQIGGLYGYLGGAGLINATASNIRVIGSAPDCYNVGGIAGERLEMINDSNNRANFSDIEVYGYRQVGGLSGTSGTLYGVTASDIRVTGNGYNVGGISGGGTTSHNGNYSNITVKGLGACIGGISGSSATIYRTNIQNVTVLGTGDPSQLVHTLTYGGEETNFYGGDAIGGISGGSNGSTVFHYSTAKDIYVYGHDYVGGIKGFGANGMQYTSVRNAEVEATGTKYVAGGWAYDRNYTDSYYNVLADVSINAPNALEYVGGVYGLKMADSHWGSANMQVHDLVIHTGQSTETGTKYVGGYAGCIRYTYITEDLNIEAEIVAPNGTYVGGVVGYMNNDNNPEGAYSYSLLNRVLAVSKITAGDKIGGVMGYGTDSAFPSGANMYYTWTVATQIVADEDATEVAYFYNRAGGRDFSSIDVNRHRPDTGFAYPYKLRLWDGSGIQKGSDSTTLTRPGDQDVTFKTFVKIKTNVYELQDKSLPYWKGHDNTEDQVALSEYDQAIALVSTADLKNRLFYADGTHSLGLGTLYATYESKEVPISGNTVTYLRDYDEILYDYGGEWNTYAVVDGITEMDDTFYLPIPIFALYLCEEKAVSNTSGASLYADLGLGTATLSATSLREISYVIKDGTQIPGTKDALLQAEFITKIPGAGTITPDINIRTTPRVYSADAYTMNLEFDELDRYNGAYIHVYRTDGAAGATAEDTDGYLFTLAASESVSSYSFYYDYRTPLTIRITATSEKPILESENLPEGTVPDTIYASVDVKPNAHTRRVVASGDFLFGIGTNGDVIRYKKTYTSVENDKTKVVYTGNPCINISVSSEGTILALDNTGVVHVIEGVNNVDGFTLTAPAVPPSGVSAASVSVEEPEVPLTEPEISSAKVRDVLIVGTSGSAVKERTVNTVGSSQAKPMYEFDYKGYHICTYLTYSLIYDGDTVTRREMQLFVKNGQLFALDAPDDIIPGNIILDVYKNSNYMTVLSKYGKMVDLMTAINYPEDFVNRGIKNVSSNLYSDEPVVLVEYENGNIISFNYLTGNVYYKIDATGEGENTYVDGDFLDYIMGFFQERLDIAYGDVSGAYDNALTMLNYYNKNPWQEWFGENYESGTGSSPDEMTDPLDPPEMAEGEIAPDTEEGVFEEPGVAPEDGEGFEPSGELMDGAGAESFDSLEESEEAIGEYTEGGSGTGGGYTSQLDNLMMEELETQEGTGESPKETTDPSGADSSNEMPGYTANGTWHDLEKTEEEIFRERQALSGEVIIAYSGDAKGYALYAIEELLSDKVEEVVSLENKMENFLENGGKIPDAEITKLSLQINDRQKSGILIICGVAIAIGTLIIFLEIQKYTRLRRED